MEFPYGTYASYLGKRASLPNIKLIVAIATNFNANPEWLLTGEGEMLREAQDATNAGEKGVESPENENTVVGMGRHLEWLTAHIDRLNDKIATLEGRGGPFAGDQEVIGAVDSLDQTDYNTIRDLILGFAWWAKRYGSQETESDDAKTRKPVRV